MCKGETHGGNTARGCPAPAYRATRLAADRVASASFLAFSSSGLGPSVFGPSQAITAAGGHSVQQPVVCTDSPGGAMACAPEMMRPAPFFQHLRPAHKLMAGVAPPVVGRAAGIAFSCAASPREMKDRVKTDIQCFDVTMVWNR
eukprot:6211891-Pleurochrysis_carterae.AAC.4